MITNIPDILNEYRNSLLYQKMPSQFTYYTTCNMGMTFDSSPWYMETAPPASLNNEISEYNIWTGAILCPKDIFDQTTNEISSAGISPNSADASEEALSADSSESISSSPDSSDESGSDNSSETMLPSMELIIPHKRLSLAPSCFIHGCMCGHNFEFRDMAYETRKRRNTRSPGVTIRPKTPPITAKLRHSN